ncbi:MAG: PAS domain-containing protein, partial [Roseococcus sp.]
MMRDVPEEGERLAALRGLGILDTSPEADFDHVVRLAARLLDVPIALISLVDQDRQWFKSVIGLDGVTETPRELAFCDHAIRGQDVMVVPDATEDPRFAGNPLVTGEPGIRFYAGAPLITSDGHALGTLCVIDRVPHQALSDRDAQILAELAGFIRDKLELRREVLRSKALAEQAALISRLISATAEAPDFANAIHAAAEAIADATGGLYCHVWRLAADRERALFVSGAGLGMLGEETYFDLLRSLVLTPANSQVAAALVRSEQIWSTLSPGPETASRPAAHLAGEQGVTLQLATPFGLGEERYVFSVGLAASPDEPEAVARLMREATAALRPMLRRHLDEADGRLYRRLIATSENGVLVSEPPFEEPGPRIIFANAAFERMSGSSLAEINGRSPRFIFGPGTDPKARARFNAEIKAGRSVTEEVLQYRKDGTTYWTSIRIIPVLDSTGVATHYISAQSDITAAREARLERDALTRDLQHLVGAIPGVLMRHRVREDGRWIRAFIAPGVEALTGFTVEEAFAFGWWVANIDQADKARLYEALGSANDGGQSRTDFRFRRKDGIWIWVRIMMRGHIASDGAREVIGIWSDVSEEYRVAAEREAKTRELETVMATIPGVLIRTRREPDGNWKRILVTPNITELTGHSVEEAMAEDWFPTNADPAALLRAKAYFQSESVMSPWEGEFQFRHKLGHWIRIRRRSRGYVDENGVEELVGIWNDVSEEYRLAAEREARTRELATVIDTVPGVLIRNRRQADGSWKRIQVSPGITEVTGHTVAEALEDDWLDGLSPPDLAKRVAAFFSGQEWRFPTEHEFLFQHKLGHLIWIRRRSRSYQDENGVQEVVSVWNDITD